MTWSMPWIGTGRQSGSPRSRMPQEEWGRPEGTGAFNRPGGLPEQKK